KVGSPGQANNAEGAPYLDPNEIFGELGDLHSLVGLDEGGGFSYGQKIEYTKNEMLSTDNVALFHDPHDFVELNDLEVPEQTKDDGSWGQDKQA
ncbi:hypothetical protein L195_g040627, partial [Trifolium pratense]